VNGDGKADLVSANPYGNVVNVLLGIGTGSFGAAQSYAAGGSPYSVALADFNGDGNADLAAANSGGTVSVLLGTGAGAFLPPVIAAAGAGARGPAVGDFNGDGRVDAAAFSAGASNVSVLLNDGIWPALDAPSITITDPAAVIEGNTGTVSASFTVNLSAAYGQTVTFSTPRGQQQRPRIIRPPRHAALPGQTTTITVLSTDHEYSESFLVNLSSATPSSPTRKV
jgi:hypothetical protein